MTKQRFTGQMLLDFLDDEAKSGRMHSGTASSRRSAVREVLQVNFEDGWRDVTCDYDHVQALLNTFDKARSGEFGSGTMSSYRSNFRRTVELYLEVGEQAADAGANPRISYRFQLREGLLVDFALPEDLSAAEASRLARFITALPLDAEPRAS